MWSHEPFLQKIMSEYNDWQNKPRFLIKNNSSRFAQAWQNFFPVFPIQTWTLNPLIWDISPVYVVIFAVNCQPVHHTNIVPALINRVPILFFTYHRNDEDLKTACVMENPPATCIILTAQNQFEWFLSSTPIWRSGLAPELNRNANRL